MALLAECFTWDGTEARRTPWDLLLSKRAQGRVGWGGAERPAARDPAGARRGGLGAKKSPREFHAPIP